MLKTKMSSVGASVDDACCTEMSSFRRCRLNEAWHAAVDCEQHGPHLYMSRSSTQTTESFVAATVAERGTLYMSATSPNMSPCCFILTLKLTLCRRSSTCGQQQRCVPGNHVELPAHHVQSWEERQWTLVTGMYAL